MPTVRLVDEEENQLGIVAIDDAKRMAHEQELDLVEVSPKTNPPVCRIMDYGKFLYYQKKIEQKHRKMQKKSEVKAIRMSFRTDQHDLETKVRQARRFLEDRDVVKVSLVFRGREAAHGDIAVTKMNQFAKMLAEVSTVEQSPKRQGNTLMMILSPSK